MVRWGMLAHKTPGEIKFCQLSEQDMRRKRQRDIAVCRHAGRYQG